MMNKKCFSYCRVSSEGQLEGTGLDRQIESIREWCVNNSVEIVGEYFESITGTSYSRPVYLQMIEDIKSSDIKIDYVIFERTDRIARDIIVQETILADLFTLGVMPVSSTEGYLDGDINRVLQRRLLACFNSYEKDKVVQRLKSGRVKKKALTGKCEGAKPYADLLVVNRIKTLRSEGHTYQEITDLLNKDHVPAKRGGSWYPASVRSVLLVAS